MLCDDVAACRACHFPQISRKRACQSRTDCLAGYLENSFSFTSTPVSNLPNMTSAAQIGQRRSYDGALCTVRYIGEVAGTTGSWLGVEWDDPSRGKHDGQHKGVRHFRVLSSPTPFINRQTTLTLPRQIHIGHSRLVRPPHAPDRSAEELPLGAATQVCHRPSRRPKRANSGCLLRQGRRRGRLRKGPAQAGPARRAAVCDSGWRPGRIRVRPRRTVDRSGLSEGQGARSEQELV